MRWLQRVALWTIPLAYIGSQAGWVVAEVGRQPWAIQDMFFPVGAAISNCRQVPFTAYFLYLPSIVYRSALC